MDTTHEARPSGELRVLCALAPRSGPGAAEAAAAAGRGFSFSFPSELRDIEAAIGEDRADVIVADFRFASGAFADWLSLWPLPSVILLDGSEDPVRVENALRDESSFFLLRDEGGAWTRLLPILIRKAATVREAIARQNAHLAMTEHQYLNLMRAIPDVVYVLDACGRFTYLNDAVRRFGWDPARLIGRHFTTIVHPEDAPKVSREDVLPVLCGQATGPDGAPKLFDERRSGDRMTRNLELRLLSGGGRPEGDPNSWALTSINAFGEVNAVGFSMPELRGAPGGTIGVIRDVTQRRVNEDALKRDLRSREVLLREIHHRVKNNLQVVSSLLNLQQHAVEDSRAQAVFLECQTQIQSMAMVHEQIYQRAELDGVGAAGYVESLVRYLAGVYEADWHGISVSVEAKGELRLDLDSAIPAAIIVNELVSNAFKHAFPDGRKGSVRVRVDLSASGEALIEVSDDGVGFEVSKAAKPSGAPRSLGLDLVQALARQLRGELGFRDREGGGSVCLLRFKPLLREGPLEAAD